MADGSAGTITTGVLRQHSQLPGARDCQTIAKRKRRGLPMGRQRLILRLTVSPVHSEINASPEAVFDAVVDAFDGKVNWWLPHLSSRLRAGASIGEKGALFDVTVHTMVPLRFTGKTIDVQRPDRVVVHYVGGAFQGEALWTFEKLKDNTILRLRWRTHPSSLMTKVASLFVAIDKGHSQVMHEGFANLNEYLGSAARTASAP
jgi:uncharacterized protein YndB with AHSA1/START domain